MTLTISTPGATYINTDITISDGASPAIHVTSSGAIVVLSSRLVGAGGSASTNPAIFIDEGCAGVSIIGAGGSIYGFGMGLQGLNAYLLTVQDLFVQGCYIRGMQVAGDDIEIRNCRIENILGSTWSANPSMIGIEASGVSSGGVNVLHNRVQNCIPPAPSTQEGGGISISNFGANSRVIGNVVHNDAQAPLRSDGLASTYGLWISEGGDVIAAHNTFERIGVGIAYPSGTTGYVDDNTFRACTTNISTNSSVGLGQNL